MSLRAGWLAAGMLVLAGCGGYGLEKPELSVVGVDLLKGDLLQQNLRVRMHVQNPNPRALEVGGITYQIEVAGERLAYGESERDFVVPALGSADFDVSVTANAAGTLLKLVTGGMRSDALDYRLFGTVHLKSGLVRNLPFEQRGRLDLH